MTRLVTETTLPRTYLYVPPEEKGDVQALGASWDADSKCWYIDADEPSAPFSRWLEEGVETDEYTIMSGDSFVVSATVPCRHCNAAMEVICIHCVSGTINGAEQWDFTVSNIWAMDQGLARQLTRWPTFQRVTLGGESYFANCCSRCGAAQDDMLLHSEPGEPFFDVVHAPSRRLGFVALVGAIHLSGDEHFGLD